MASSPSPTSISATYEGKYGQTTTMCRRLSKGRKPEEGIQVVPRGAMASGNTHASADGFQSLGTGMFKRNSGTTALMATQDKQRMPSNFGNLARFAFSCDIGW